MIVCGIAGRSGAGKTTLIERVLPILLARGLAVSTIKHTHHDLDLDRPGKDTHRHRDAGAHEVILSAGSRWALLREAQADAQALLARLAPVDLVLIEGFRAHPYPKIEIVRHGLDRPALWPGDDTIRAIATDDPALAAAIPTIALSDGAALARAILDIGRPFLA